jgi:hypothetical protein
MIRKVDTQKISSNNKEVRKNKHEVRERRDEMVVNCMKPMRSLNEK